MKTLLLSKTAFLVFFILLFTSCATKNDIIYLNNLSTASQNSFKWSESYLQSNDIVSIRIAAESPILSEPYNISLGQNGMQMQNMQMQGYLVTNDGTVNIPILGTQKIAGLTLELAEKQIQNALIEKGYLKNPIVTCRLLNAKFTVLGEVKSPGTFTFFENNLTLLQALGLAGDLNINGIRKKITIIRTEKDTQTYAVIDITKKDWLNSPYYFIKPNDVIIVDPNLAKVKSAGIIGNPGNLIAIISVVLSSFLLIKSL